MKKVMGDKLEWNEFVYESGPQIVGEARQTMVAALMVAGCSNVLPSQLTGDRIREGVRAAYIGSKFSPSEFAELSEGESLMHEAYANDLYETAAYKADRDWRAFRALFGKEGE